MKKLLIALLIVPSLLTAQTEKINFTKKLVYMDTSGREIKNANLYYSPQGLFAELPETMAKYMMKSNIIAPVFLDLDRNITFSDNYYKIDSIPTFSFKKLNEKDNVGNYTCNYYKISNRKYDEDTKLCIIEDSNLDIVSAFNNNTQDKVKGYPVIASFGYEKTFILKNIQNTTNSVSVNFKGYVQKMLEEKERYSDDYIISDSVVAAENTTPSYDYYDEIELYTSNYKKINELENIGGLGIHEISGDSPYWKQIPQYCKNIEGIIPAFKNEELKEHAQNYAGQLCDMYLSFTDYPSIAEKETLDFIRYEENYFRNTSIDKRDRKLLDNFLNSLD